MLRDLVETGEVVKHLCRGDSRPSTTHHRHQRIGNPLISRIHGRRMRDDPRFKMRATTRRSRRLSDFESDIKPRIHEPEKVLTLGCLLEPVRLVVT
jgi:hypothetical protein